MRTLLFFCLLCAATMMAQTKTITGIITDENALPLPGVNVMVKETNKGTQTNFNGEYKIQAKVGEMLVFSYPGYTSEKWVIDDKNIISFTMTPNLYELNEVIVTGKARPKSSKAVGYAVTTISSSDIKSRSERKVVRRLNGKVAGVQVVGNNGATGSGSKFIIRSKSKIAENSNFTMENEDYARIQENIFKRVETAPLSTFSIDVDRAGYSNIRRFINNGQKIPKDAVKIEEMINYFNYEYETPKGSNPFAIYTEVAQSPWNKDAKLVKIGLKGKEIDTKKAPPSNLVFLIDVSGSMNSPNKLPFLKSSFEILVNQLREQDKVAIVVYAGAAGLVLPSTSGAQKEKIMEALNALQAGGSTAGGEGIQLAYKIAEEQFLKKGNNRVILATDGDFNVGPSSNRNMEDLIVEKRKSGIFLTVLGFGMGNYKDAKMETLADKGNGNHAYIDSMQEARKMLGTEIFGTLYTIAKDVKIQVEFNPALVQAYRLIGYENRLLQDEDFNDDTKDAGELGSGHTVTALYEIIPMGIESPYVKKIDNLKYTSAHGASNTKELLTVKFRYKEPNASKSKLIEKTVWDRQNDLETASEDFKFSAAVALFGMQLRKSLFINTFKKSDVLSLAESGRGKDKEGYRAEFIRLVKSY